MNTYFTRLIDYRKQLSGSSEEISGESFVTHLFTYLPKEFATTINIFEGQAPPPTSQHIMDAIRLDEEKAALVTEIGEASTGDALYFQRVYRGRGRGGSGRLDHKRRTGAPTAKWTITPPKHAASGSGLRAETAIPVEMTALEETML